MRVNIYAEEMTDRVEIVTKEIDGRIYTGVRFFVGFPFVHREGDDDSSAITFWGKRDLYKALKKALDLLKGYDICEFHPALPFSLEWCKTHSRPAYICKQSGNKKED